MSKNTTILLTIVLLALAGVWLYFSNRNAEPITNVNTKQNVESATNVNTNQNANANTNQNANVNTNQNEGEDNGANEENSVQAFSLVASNFKYSVTEIRVKQGQIVKIKLSNADGFHDLNIDEFNVSTSQLQTGQEETIEFVADKTGTFEYYCSVGQHRQMGMVGKLIVE